MQGVTVAAVLAPPGQVYYTPIQLVREKAKPFESKVEPVAPSQKNDLDLDKAFYRGNARFQENSSIGKVLNVQV